MPQPPRHPAQGQPISAVVGQASAIVNSAEANVSIPKLSNDELESVMADFTRIAEDAKAELERDAKTRREQAPSRPAADR
jgi:hypothetical protein